MYSPYPPADPHHTPTNSWVYLSARTLRFCAPRAAPPSAQSSTSTTCHTWPRPRTMTQTFRCSCRRLADDREHGKTTMKETLTLSFDLLEKGTECHWMVCVMEDEDGRQTLWAGSRSLRDPPGACKRGRRCGAGARVGHQGRVRRTRGGHDPAPRMRQRRCRWAPASKPSCLSPCLHFLVLSAVPAFIPTGCQDFASSCGIGLGILARCIVG